jgi:hypothetical protein
MANRKISDLTALTAPATGDLLPIVDISEAASADKNKKITIGELFASIPLGSAAAPSIAFEGDSNTGIYSPGADQIGIAKGGLDAIRIDSSGRLLVGTSTAFVEGVNNALTSNQLSKGAGSNVRCISDTRTVGAINNTTVDAWVGRKADGNPFNSSMAGHFYVTVGGANCFTGVYSIVTCSNGTSSATLTAVSTVTRGTSPVSSVQIANDGAGGAIKLTITYINNSGVVTGLESYVSFVGLAA